LLRRGILKRQLGVSVTGKKQVQEYYISKNEPFHLYLQKDKARYKNIRLCADIITKAYGQMRRIKYRIFGKVVNIIFELKISILGEKREAL
jgi:hypothetical protein